MMPSDRASGAKTTIPNPVCAVVGDVLGGHYYNHTSLNTLFLEHGAPGDPPEGNCVQKCTNWLKRANDTPGIDPFSVLGGVLKDFMEIQPSPWGSPNDVQVNRKKRIVDTLAQYGLSYHQGGRILGAGSSPATKDLKSIIRSRDLSSLEAEYQRALDSLTSDPAAAVTAACAIFESFCRIYIKDERLTLPSKLTAKELWSVVQKDLGLRPAEVADDDLKRILGGLASVVDGLAALRTHVGSAHGRGKMTYDVAPRHARLAVNTSHSLVFFLIEAWDDRRGRR
jgi:hypothetical protein